MTVTTPAPAPLSRVPNVELMHTGTWHAMTGVVTLTRDDLAAAVAALDCPSVHRPILKLGHVDPRFDGEPAVGFVDNMAIADDGRTLVGDFVGMPGWLGPVLASAYPSRSVEGQHSYHCQLGHVHGFAVTAVALLGVAAPAIGTLASLHDVAGLYGVVAAAAATAGQGTPVSVPFVVSASGGLMGTTPTVPRPVVVHATVTTEDVRRKFYDVADWSVWIEEIQVDPLQLVVVDDDTNQRSRVPVIVDAGADGTAAVTFADPVPVVIRYDDVAASRGAGQVVRFSSRESSRPPDMTPVPPSGGDVAFTQQTLAAMRSALSLPPTADEAAIAAAVVELNTQTPAGTPAPPPVTVPPAGTPADDESDDDADADDDSAAGTPGAVAPARTVVLDAAAYEQLQAAAAAGRTATVAAAEADRRRLVDAAVHDGRIPTSRQGEWLKALSADPGLAKTLAGLRPGLVPVTELGHAGGADTDADDPYTALYGSKGA